MKSILSQLDNKAVDLGRPGVFLSLVSVWCYDYAIPLAHACIHGARERDLHDIVTRVTLKLSSLGRPGALLCKRGGNDHRMLSCSHHRSERG